MYSINVREILHSHAHDINLLHKTITICATLHLYNVSLQMIMEVIAFSSLLSCLALILMLSETLLSF